LIKERLGLVVLTIRILKHDLEGDRKHRRVQKSGRNAKGGWSEKEGSPHRRKKDHKGFKERINKGGGGTNRPAKQRGGGVLESSKKNRTSVPLSEGKGEEV